MRGNTSRCRPSRHTKNPVIYPVVHVFLSSQQIRRSSIIHIRFARDGGCRAAGSHKPLVSRIARTWARAHTHTQILYARLHPNTLTPSGHTRPGQHTLSHPFDGRSNARDTQLASTLPVWMTHSFGVWVGPRDEKRSSPAQVADEEGQASMDRVAPSPTRAAAHERYSRSLIL